MHPNVALSLMNQQVSERRAAARAAQLAKDARYLLRGLRMGRAIEGPAQF
jgi:hypothetical protein